MPTPRLVTLNPDGSPQVSLVWVALQSTPDGDELVTAHLGEHKKVRNVRNDHRVALTIAAVGDVAPEMRPYLAVYGTARIVEGGAPELLKELAATLSNPDVFPPAGAPPGFLHSHPHRQDRRHRPLGVLRHDSFNAVWAGHWSGRSRSR